jgi:predicted transport protein
MFLFKVNKDGEVTEIRERPFKKEKYLQDLCERNLDGIFELKFVRSEFIIHNFRIDTLAFDTENKSFVIIEYKKDRNFSVVDQGYAYLSLMLNNKADFILEYNENCEENLKRKDVDWSQSKVMFVSTAFTDYQKESINFKDLPIELWEVRYFDNDTIYFTQHRPSGATESIKTISKDSETIQKVSKEIKVFTEEDHINNVPDDTQEMYEKFKQAILNIDDSTTIKPTLKYLGFIANKHNVCDINIQKKSLKMWINLRFGELDDPKKIARNVSTVGHWGNGDYEITIEDDENLEYIISLVKQSYKKPYNR